MKPNVARNLIMSRLLMVQSKRLVLASLERRAAGRDAEATRGRAEKLRAELEHANDNYRDTMLAFGTSGDPDYWLVVYGKLIETAGGLVERMHEQVPGLRSDRRYEVAGEIEMLEAFVGQWRESMRATIATGRSAA